ncbi:unnamed protein product [Ectocarpus sp. 12 AP-2014]
MARSGAIGSDGSSSTAAAAVAAAASCAGRPAAGRRRSCRRFSSTLGPMASSAVTLLLALLSRNPGGADAQGFEYGDPIDVVVTAGDTLAMSFEGGLATAVAVSFQQCSGDVYMDMDVSFNGTSLVTSTAVETSKCVRVVGQSASADDSAIFYDNLCAFQNSGPVGQGYLEESAELSSTTVDPEYITAQFTNTGTVTASAQVVMFSTEYPAPNSDEAIDRVVAEFEQEGNIFTVDAEFQADGTEDENFCAGDDGCSLAAYYIEIDTESGDADRIFGTTCQATNGVLLYEGFTGVGDSTFSDTEVIGDDEETTATDEVGVTDDEIAETTTDDAEAVVNGTGGARTRSRALSTTSFDVTACVEFPKNTEAVYRMYIVVSPDTDSYTRTGYGLQDQLMYASDLITVEEDDSDYECPEVVDEEEGSGARPRVVLTASRASTAVAAGLAVAAAAARA